MYMKIFSCRFYGCSRTVKSAAFIASMALLLCFPAIDAFSLDFQGAEVDYTLRIIGSDQKDLDGDSTGAVWSNVLAMRFPLQFSKEGWYLVPGVSFTSLYYRYDTDKERAVPTDNEWRELTSFVPMVDATVRWEFLNRSWGRYSTELGVGFQFPFPLKSWDVPGEEDNSGKITPALYSDAQFVLPVCALQGNWSISQQFDVFFRVSSYFPLYHGWDDKGLPFSDGLIFGFHIGAFIPF